MKNKYTILYKITFLFESYIIQDGYNALMLACMKGHTHIVKYLLENPFANYQLLLNEKSNVRNKTKQRGNTQIT